MVPYDVLVDPLSLPSHPVIQERENVLDILYGEAGRTSAMNEDGSPKVSIHSVQSYAGSYTSFRGIGTDPAASGPIIWQICTLMVTT